MPATGAASPHLPLFRAGPAPVASLIIAARSGPGNHGSVQRHAMPADDHRAGWNQPEETAVYRVPITDVQPGSVLGACIFTDSGRPLLQSGVALTSSTVAQIASRGYTRLIVLDHGEAPQPEPLAPDVRTDVMQVLAPAAEYLLALWAQGDGARTDQARMRDLALRRAVRRFVQSVGANVLSVCSGPVRVGAGQWMDGAVGAAAIAVALARTFKLEQVALERLAAGMLLRDVAMLALPEAIRRAPGDLPDDAWEQVRSHPLRTYHTLVALDWLDESARLVVLQHHERHDGSGYPAGLRGLPGVERSRRALLDRKVILPIADFAAVADVLTALCTDRPYRESRPPDEVRALLQDMAGAHLNGAIVGAFLEHWRPPEERRSATVRAS